MNEPDQHGPIQPLLDSLESFLTNCYQVRGTLVELNNTLAVDVIDIVITNVTNVVNDIKGNGHDHG
jgi:hypothetical protein